MTSIKLSIWGANYELDDIPQDAIKDEDFETEDISQEENKDKTSKKKIRAWVRKPIYSQSNPEDVEVGIDENFLVLDGKAKIYSVWRPMGSGYLITLTLINIKESSSEDKKLNPSDCLYQVGFKCKLDSGVIKEYPSVNRLSYDEEEEELALQYKNKIAYAIGHGCSASWDITSEKIDEVETSWIPQHEVKGIDFKINSSEKSTDNFLSLKYLSSATDDLVPNLNLFLNGYRAWYQILKSQKVDDRFEKAKSRIVGRIDDAIKRMQNGIDLIRDDREVLKSFQLANQAMFNQMVYGSSSLNRDRNSNFNKPDFNKYDFKWRPFQLAFQLLVIESLVNPKSDFRDVVDLIWFPTGGGKTESYLSVASFELIYRRIKYREKGCGTSVIKRYTLRLLTAQQFQRASTLICALELIRRKNMDLLLSEPFSLGLWVGEASSPNKFTDTREKGAKERFKELRNDERPKNPFQLQNCPICGTKIIPDYYSEEPDDYGIKVTESSFKFYCPSDDCEMHEKIPVTVVDEDIYINPPSFLIGTIDKFARLAWDSRAKNLFGNKIVKPPYLIIQDELHLISGPLGTIAGVYESAISSIIKSKELIEPKYIAATATIRRSSDQVEKLYGKKVHVFPPPGISSEDSYFAKVDKLNIGRLYLGLMAQGHTPVTSLVHTSAVLSQIPIEAELSDDNLRDAYWTQIIYHNSRRELGKSITLSNDDIPSRVKVIAKDEDNLRILSNIEELSASRDSEEIPSILSKLTNKYDHEQMVDILPCTNMISVGVDVSRLGLMLIYGQPKTTAEYIQASSRVGRKSNTHPGIVVTLYTPTKPRDRSHYENFIPYHNAIYRYVEPSSVTPFAPRALERALHASLIVLMRHAGDLNENNDAGKFNPDDEKAKFLIQIFKDRLSASSGDEKENVYLHLNNIVNSWLEMIEKSKELNKPLRFYEDGKQFISLMSHFGKDKKEISWKTLNSMRNVDAETAINIR